MMMRGFSGALLLALSVAVPAARGDRQVIAPGIGSQVSVVVEAGANGICESAAGGDDVQVLPVGQSLPSTTAIQCGPNRIADTAAAGDDRQLVAVGAGCTNANTDVIDSGPDGLANSTAAGDDDQVLAPGVGTGHTACILTGPNARADTVNAPVGDDVRLLAVGGSEPNTAVIRCGSNRRAETFANNAIPGGDDVQLVSVNADCNNASTVVVDSGANGRSETRAQGVELVISRAPAKRLVIRRGRNSGQLLVKLAVFNGEFGTTAPGARSFVLDHDDGSCPNGTILQVDADARTPGAQPTGTAPRGRRAKATALVRFEVGDVASVDRDVPFRCSITFTANAVDTPGAADDAINTANNSTRVDLEVVDLNDL